MRTIIATIATLVLTLTSHPALAVEEGDRAPAFSLDDAKGHEIAFPEHSGGAPAIVFFWATWCPYCHALMPYLQQIKADYAEHGVEVYAVSFKDDGDPVEHMHELGHDFVVLPVGDLVADDYDVWSAPGIVVVDGNGVVRYKRKSIGADVKPGKEIAEFWDGKIRAALQLSLQQGSAAP